jgi:hypothetical protein
MNDMKSSVGGMSVALFSWVSACLALEPCRIEVVEKGSGWPVPLVELRTTHNVRLVTDNAGVIAFDLPELMGCETWFDVLGHGYERPKDGFGMRGVRVVPEPGKTVKVEVTRTIVAKRLGRLTGGGIFGEPEAGPGKRVAGERLLRLRHRAECGLPRQALLGVGRHHVARYLLGVYDMTSAVTPVQPLASFEPPVRLAYEYFRDGKGFPRGVAKMPGSGPTWISGTRICRTSRAPSAWWLAT